MIRFLRDRNVSKVKKNAMGELLKIAKDERERFMREKIRELISEELENSGINRRIDDILKTVRKMDKKVENLKSSLVPLSRSKADSIRKIKMKRMVIELLTKYNRMTSSDLSVHLDLSRTRCSEYLKELERDGVTRGILVSRQKFYELSNQ